MITIFHLFMLCAVVAGCVFGILLGVHSFGWVGGILGALLGTYAGFVMGKAPAALSFAILRSQLERSSVAVLKKRLQTEYFISHLIIAQLVIRGEPIDDFRDYIFSLLCSDLSDERRFGWLNLNIWFPESAKQIEDFDPADPPLNCRKRLERIKNHPDQGFSSP